MEAKKPRKKNNEPSEDMQHFPSTSNYDLSELYADLLSFAVAHLRLGGRLVCWIPIFKSVLENLPITHRFFNVQCWISGRNTGKRLRFRDTIASN